MYIVLDYVNTLIITFCLIILKIEIQVFKITILNKKLLENKSLKASCMDGTDGL